MTMHGDRGQGARRPHGEPCNDAQRRSRLPGASGATPVYRDRFLLGLPKSIAAKLVLGYGLLGMASVALVSAVFYFGTIGVLDHNLDGRITALSDRLIEQYRGRAQSELAAEVAHQLSDGIDNDSEIFLLLGADGGGAEKAAWIKTALADAASIPAVGSVVYHEAVPTAGTSAAAKAGWSLDSSAETLAVEKMIAKSTNGQGEIDRASISRALATATAADATTGVGK